MELAGTRQHKNSHSKALRKSKKRQFKGPDVACRKLGARASASRESTFCMLFINNHTFTYKIATKHGRQITGSVWSFPMIPSEDN